MTESWKSDFPVAWTDDHYVTRRGFTKSLALVSGAVCAANGALLALGGGPRAAPPARVASALDVPVGASKLFEYAGDRWLLVRLGEDRFVAVGQKCTHLGCPVLWKAADRRFHCPCHEGYFDEEGKVLAGPPPRPLPRLEIRREGDELWASATTS
jgi:nitrite reductase/ring-hydroxylating ferredoxin subunit